MRLQSVRKSWIWISINRTWTSRWHLGRSCRAGHQGLDAGETTKKTEVHAWTRIRVCETIHSEPVARDSGTITAKQEPAEATDKVTYTCHLNRHLFILGFVNSRTLERCYDKYVITSQVLFNCNIPGEWSYLNLELNFTKSYNCQKTPLNKVLHFIPFEIRECYKGDPQLIANSGGTRWLLNPLI